MFPSNDLRQSRDEEVIGFILANIILEGKIFYQGNQLNKFYGYTRNPLSVNTPIEMTKLQNGIDRIGIDNIKNQFYKVMSCIKDVLACSQKSFRKVINADKSISDITLQFQIIFMAIHRLIVKEGKNTYNAELIFEKINGNCNNLTSSDLRNDRSIIAATDMIYGLIESAFVNGQDEDPAKADWSMKCVNIINRSRTEQTLYDFKIGFVEYNRTEFNKDTLEKVLKTLTAINNVGPNKTGYVLIGVGDKEEDAKKYAKLYDIDYKMEGSFPVIGVEHDAQALNLSLDRYTHSIKEYIKNCESLSDDYRDHLIKNMRAPLLYGKQLIIFKTCFSEPVTYKNEYYTREFTDVVKISPSKYPNLFNEYYKKMN